MGKMSDHNSRGLNARNEPDAPCEVRPNDYDGQEPVTTPARFPSYSPNIKDKQTSKQLTAAHVRAVFDTLVPYLERAFGPSRHVSCRTHVFDDLDCNGRLVSQSLRVLAQDADCPIDLKQREARADNATMFRASFDRPEPRDDDDTDGPEVVADGGLDISGTVTRAGASVVRWTGERRARRFVFEPRSTGGHTRIDQRWTGCEWVTTGREIVADLVVERGVEVSRDE